MTHKERTRVEEINGDHGQNNHHTIQEVEERLLPDDGTGPTVEKLLKVHGIDYPSASP